MKFHPREEIPGCNLYLKGMINMSITQKLPGKIQNSM